MSNYIVINGKRIELTEEQVKDIIAPQTKDETTVQLSQIAVGDTFRIEDHEFIVLEHSGDTTAVIRKELLSDMEFGSNNNFDGSDVDEACAEFGDEILEIVGSGNLVEHAVDLTSDDGLKDYGTVRRRCSLLTADLYRRYVEILDKFNPNNYWWLATPFSTAKHDSSSWVKCVAPSGCVYYVFYYHDYGVRPFCILKSNIFVSK